MEKNLKHTTCIQRFFYVISAWNTRSVLVGKQVAKKDRNLLLQDRTRENKKPQTILVSTWHPKFNAILSILKNNFQLILNDAKFSNIFKEKLTVTYRGKKSLSN